jgi:acetolactate synthase-1/2/3 large subunit
LAFYIGSDTDSALTGGWTLPPRDTDKKIIHLDISEKEVGNNYRTAVPLIGDAAATLARMAERARTLRPEPQKDSPRIRELRQRAERYANALQPYWDSDETPVHPMRLLKELTARLPGSHLIVCDPGVSAIYTSAFYRVRRAGRVTVFNYSMGALGYAMPAAVGAACARPDCTVLCLTGDGSFGFAAGELETLARTGADVKVFLFNNCCFGWMKAAFRFSHEPEYFATDFGQVDYAAVSRGFGVSASRIGSPMDLGPVLDDVFASRGPAFVEVAAKSEDELVPPVPQWARRARELGLPNVY